MTITEQPDPSPRNDRGDCVWCHMTAADCRAHARFDGLWCCDVCDGNHDGEEARP